MPYARNHRDPSRPREPELPVVEDPVDPGEPKIPEMPPPVPDPPEVVGVGYGSEEGYYRPEGWEPASWQPHPPALQAERVATRR